MTRATHWLAAAFAGTSTARRAPAADLATALILAATDWLGCVLALGVGASPGVASMSGFLAAATLCVLSVARIRAATRDRSLVGTLVLAAGIAVVAWFERAAVCGALIGRWHWPSRPALALAALVGGCVLQYAVGLAARPRWRSAQSSADLRYWAFGIVGLAVTLRVLYSAQLELLPEEAYYWNYSRHLDIGYLDHPPMVAWLIRAGTALVGSNEFGVRFGALICSVITSSFVYALARNLFGAVPALFALVLAQTLPFFSLAGILMTPDAPLTAAWAALAYFLERALIAERALAWLGVGIAMGLGLDSKYTIALAGLAGFIYMVWEPGARKWWVRYPPYLAVAIALGLFAPVLLWNYQHEWASFAFQTSRRLAERHQFALHKLIGSEIILIAPVGFATLVATLVRRPAAPPALDALLAVRQWRWLRCMVLTPLTVFALFSVRHEVKLDWTGAPAVAALPLMAFALYSWRVTYAQGGRPRLLAAWPRTLAVLLLIYAVGFGYLVNGLPGVGYSQKMEFAPVGWRELGRQVQVLTREASLTPGASLLVVAMDRYETASELAFYADDQARSVGATSAGHLFGGVGLMYEQWFPASAQQGADLLLVSWKREDLAERRLQPYVERLGPLETGSLLRDGHFIRRYFYRWGYGYRVPT